MFVTLVCVINGRRAAVSVRTVGTGHLAKGDGMELDTGSHLRYGDVQVFDAAPTAAQIRLMLEEAAQGLLASETAVAPARYDFNYISTSEDLVGRINYHCTDYEAQLPVDGIVGGGRKSTPINVAALLASTKSVRPVDERAGKPTKAAMVRNIMREMLRENAGPESIVARIMQDAGFGKGNAGAYFKNNLQAVIAEIA